MYRNHWLGLVLLTGLLCCQVERNQQLENLIPMAMTDDHFNVVIETSAGEHILRSYQDSTGRFDSTTTLSFLPLPVNQGFLPTYSTPDSQLVKNPVWVFSHRAETGKTVPAIPLGMLNFIEDGDEIDHFVMIPKDPKLRIMEATSFEDFSIRYDAMKYAFEYWLRNRNGVGHISRLRWQDESEAHQQLVERINNSKE